MEPNGMRLGEAARRGGWVLAAATLGAGLAFVMTGREVPAHGFLRGGTKFALVGAGTRLTGTETYRSTRAGYLLPQSVEETRAAIAKELPHAIEQGQKGGFQGRLLVVPRVEDGRVKLTFPPDETILLAPAPDGKGTMVEVLAYRRPSPFEGLLTRLRRTLRI
jgi:hypothetical protein